MLHAVIGLTGGIASGKSTASAYFQDQGIPVVDADRIAHELTAPGAAGTQAVRKHFGETFIDATGAMDRQKMRSLVFSDPAAKEKLESLLHPLIEHEARSRIEALSKTHPLVIFDCALLLENERWRHLVDRVLMIDASEETRIGRLARRNGFSREQAQAIIRAQMPADSMRELADTVVVNEADPQSFLLSLTDLYKKWTEVTSG